MALTCWRCQQCLFVHRGSHAHIANYNTMYCVCHCLPCMDRLGSHCHQLELQRAGPTVLMRVNRTRSSKQAMPAVVRLPEGSNPRPALPRLTRVMMQPQPGRARQVTSQMTTDMRRHRHPPKLPSRLQLQETVS